MKKYEITILTGKGPVKITYSSDRDLKTFEQETAAKYGTFITLNTKEI